MGNAIDTLLWLNLKFWAFAVVTIAGVNSNGTLCYTGGPASAKGAKVAKAGFLHAVNTTNPAMVRTAIVAYMVGDVEGVPTIKVANVSI